MNLCMGKAMSTPQDKKSATNGAATAATTTGRKQSFVSRLRKKFGLSYHRDSSKQQHQPPQTAAAPTTTTTTTTTTPTKSANPRRGGRRSVVPSLPRPPTLNRMESEKRDRLKPYEPPHHERRTLSAERRPLGPNSPTANGGPKASSRSLQPIQSQSSTSLKDFQEIHAQEEAGRRKSEPVASVLGASDEKKAAEREREVDGGIVEDEGIVEEGVKREVAEVAEVVEVVEVDLAKKVEGCEGDIALVPPPPPPPPTMVAEREGDPRIVSASEERLSDNGSDDSASKEGSMGPPLVSKEIEDEMEWRWILNLSMHFRDESNREKFFVTYAQEKNVRRRITISCDYRNAEDGTLEKDLSSLRFQRDKSAKIYEAIRDSLQDIMFYETITNLKLQTSEGRLHVHVTEDINEIIPYPPIMAIEHLRCPKIRESDLEFDSHLSGFVYTVRVKGEIMIKKEIPGPDTVDEFLYEINALYALADSDNVIRFGGCIIDDQRQKVKGLLISYAPKGALIDILFNQRGKLPWPVRERWAKQIVSGLSEIHEAGYVQGDFTLSNIVIDEHDSAKIIDINRRGCPVGWEPPEITGMIVGLQRIGMYIGVKSDVFQLGMVLWGMAHEFDEPESKPRPLTMDHAPDDVPAYFRRIVEACLCDRPQGRPSAKDIIALFPERIDDAPLIVESARHDDGRPLPAITQWGNGYFPNMAPSYAEDLEPLRLLATTDSGQPQVIDAAPSESDFDDDDDDDGHDAPRNTVLSSISSLVGGVDLAPTTTTTTTTSTATATAIPIPEIEPKVALWMPVRHSYEDGRESLTPTEMGIEGGGSAVELRVMSMRA